MTKNELRSKYKTLRSTLDTTHLGSLSLCISEKTLELPIWDKTFFHIFLSISERKEVDTSALISILKMKEKTLITSKTNFETASMKHYIFDAHTALLKNRYNILEPLASQEVLENAIDVVFVPLMAFDTRGNRIGYGKGYYDQFLRLCRKDVIKVGLSFFEAEPPFGEVYESDVCIDYCVTPHKIYKF